MHDPVIATRSSLPNRKRRWPWFVAGTVAIILVAPLLPLPYREPQVIMSAIGGLWAVAFFIQNGHKEDARFNRFRFGFIAVIAQANSASTYRELRSDVDILRFTTTLASPHLLIQVQ